MDYIGRALVSDALREWRHQLEGGSRTSPLRDLEADVVGTLDLAGAHPSGLAQLFAGRPTLVSSLFREGDAREAALRVVRSSHEHAEACRLAAGLATGALVVGTVAWTHGGVKREAPLLLRPISFDSSRGDDTQIVLHHHVALNPVIAGELRRRFPDRSFASSVAGTIAGSQFDPRPLWNEIRDLGDELGPDLEVKETLLIGSFDDPEQRLMDDLDECDHLIASNPVLASVAGDRGLRDQLLAPLPAPTPGDRDPFAERGIGDLDDVQFAALDVVATGRSVFLHVPPGADAVGMAAAIAADGAASGRTVAIVGGTPRSVVAVADALIKAGAGDIFVTGSNEGWNTAARSRLLESMTSPVPPMDEAVLRESGERLLEARAELRDRFEDLHVRRAPWGVSAYAAVQEIVRLTSSAEPPGTRVRLPESAVEYIATHGIDVVALAAARDYEARIAAETQGALFAEETLTGFTAIPPDAAPAPEPRATGEGTSESEPERRWWEGTVLDEDLGAAIDDGLTTFLTRHLPKLRSAASEAAVETGVDEATTLTSWADQVRLFDDIRATLDTFSPTVFQGSLADLVAVTASDGGRDLPKRDRKDLRKRAESLLRPGRTTDGLHEALVLAHQRAVRWRAHCGSGGWPKVPDHLDVYSVTIDEAWEVWARIAATIEAVAATPELADQPWSELVEALESLTDVRRAPIEDSAVRETQQELSGLGLDELLDDLAARSVPISVAASEVEFAWWASAFEAIIATEPRLAEYGAIGTAVEEFLDCDRSFGASRLSPLLRAVGERRRATIANRQDDARDLFATLVDGADGPFRDLWSRFPELVAALRPVVLCAAEQVSAMVPPSRAVDTVVLLGIESTAFAEVVPAVARASQVVALGDSHSATRGAIASLRETLPDLAIHALPHARDSRVTAVLSEYGYGRELESIPAAGGGGSFDVLAIDAVGPGIEGEVGVATTRAEVATVAARVAALSVGDNRVVVIAGNEAHATALREVFDSRGGRSANVTVVAMGRAAGIDADLVVLSLGYGPDANGEYPERLGVISSETGLRAVRQALVATTRDLLLVTALTPEYWDWAIRQGEPGHGVEALADLVALGHAGPVVTRQLTGDWLLADLALRLQKSGVEVRQGLGTGGDTIPLVAGASDDAFTVAVVTDESPPSSSTSLRDQVRWQRSGLEALGWVVVPLFSLDVFMDPEAAAAQVRKAMGLVDETAEPEPELEVETQPEPEPEPEPEAESTAEPTMADIPLMPSRAMDDTDVGWGGGLSDGDLSDGGRDDEIRGNRPPHW